MLRILPAIAFVLLTSFAHGAQLAACPVSLTNPDGQALTLEKYDLRIAANGPLTLVEMEMVFRNPQPKQIEGRFLYLLPTGAAISRFAKEVDGKLMEGEVVERMRAQSIYTQILQSMRDPALLEMDQGNRFSARVFPIPAGGTTRLLLSYSQVVPLVNGERKIVIPLAGLSEIGEFNVSADLSDNRGGGADCSIIGLEGGQGRFLGRKQLKAYRPLVDMTCIYKPTSRSESAMQAGQYQMICYAPEIAKADVAKDKRDWMFYFDTSASNADMEKRRLEAIEQVLTPLDDQKAVGWCSFDVEVATGPIVQAPFPGSVPRSKFISTDLRARHALGATNLEAALKHIGEQARATKEPQRFVLVSDGIATLGAREVRDCVAALGEWPEQHVLHALVIGSKQDEKMLNAIVAKTRGRVVTLTLGNEMEKDIPRVISELTTPLGQSFEFYDESAVWIYPKTFRDVRAGSEMIVFIDKKKAPSVKPGVVWRGPDGKVIKDQPLEIAAVEVPEFAPLLQREANAALLNHLEKREQEENDEHKRADLRKQRIEVSVKNRVLCPLTSLLVLESENDYARFGIERTALADVMVVASNGIEMKKRAPIELPKVAHLGRKMALEKAKVPASEFAKRELSDDAKADAQDGTDALKKGEMDKLEAFDEAGKDGKDLAEEGVAQDQLVLQNAHPFADPAGAAAPFAPRPAEQAAQSGEPRRAETAAAETRPAADSIRGVAPAIAVGPEWVRQSDAIPTEAELNRLHQQVAGAPRDRTLRNAYANALCKAGKWDSLQGQAFEWLPFDPENPQVYEYLGKSATGLNDRKLALRAITSIAEVAPNRAALLARAGWLLLTAQKYEMAQQMFREALKNRQDDCNIFRGLGLSYWLDGKFDKAGEVYEDALKKDFDGRYGDTKRVLREEFGYLLRAELAKDPESASVVNGIARSHGVDLKRIDAFRATLCWETDANDVDLHVVDPDGEECYYQHMKNASGLELYSDQTQGLGPEVIRNDKALSGTYHVGVNYFSSGPMGVSRGTVVIWQTVKGVTAGPLIVPFCLIPEGSDMRHVAAVKF